VSRNGGWGLGQRFQPKEHSVLVLG